MKAPKSIRRFDKAVRAELEAWHKLDHQQRGLVLMFCQCVKWQLLGTPYETLFPPEPAVDYRAD